MRGLDAGVCRVSRFSRGVARSRYQGLPGVRVFKVGGVLQIRDCRGSRFSRRVARSRYKGLPGVQVYKEGSGGETRGNGG